MNNEVISIFTKNKNELISSLIDLDSFNNFKLISNIYFKIKNIFKRQ